jgi:hypothetical protein
MRAFNYTLAVLGVFAGACAVTVGGGNGGGTSGACSVDADCGADYLCGFLEAAGCGAQGQCFPRRYVICQAYAPGCACDGTEINIACTGLPPGYASKPLAHGGTCGCLLEGASANICVSTVPCAVDGDCTALGSTCDHCTGHCGCGASDGGVCCPTPWLMYACTYPDGGAGFACHDPSLGCASSLTCGEGCDFVVEGRCGSI